MRCNCENSTCKECGNHGCINEATGKRALYIGPICDDCAAYMPAEYLIPDEMKTTQAQRPR